MEQQVKQEIDDVIIVYDNSNRNLPYSAAQNRISENHPSTSAISINQSQQHHQQQPEGNSWRCPCGFSTQEANSFYSHMQQQHITDTNNNNSESNLPNLLTTEEEEKLNDGNLQNDDEGEQQVENENYNRPATPNYDLFVWSDDDGEAGEDSEGEINGDANQPNPPEEINRVDQNSDSVIQGSDTVEEIDKESNESNKSAQKQEQSLDPEQHQNSTDQIETVEMEYSEQEQTLHSVSNVMLNGNAEGYNENVSQPVHKMTSNCSATQELLTLRRSVRIATRASQAQILPDASCVVEEEDADELIEDKNGDDDGDSDFIHTQARPYRCESCDKIFTRIDSLRTHRAEVHARIKAWKCTWPECGFRTARRHRLCCHIQSIHFARKQNDNRKGKRHNVKKSFDQTKVNLYIARNAKNGQSDKLKSHKPTMATRPAIIINPNDMKPQALTDAYLIVLKLTCPIDNEECQLPEGKILKNKPQLDAHLLQRHNIQRHRCLAKECGASFNNMMHLNDHYSTVHSQFAYNCTKCHGKPFLDHRRLHEHFYFNHESGLFGCSHCTFVSGQSRQHVLDHIQRKHKDQRNKNFFIFA